MNLLMKMFIISIIYYMFFIANYVFCLNNKHLLIMLLMLELMMMNLFMLLFMSLVMMSFNLYFLMLFLLISVCEGVLGISVLIYLIRVSGNDYFLIYSLI
uniref:NADH dehydrogenase subunit 4L n=1 Tax=Olinga feredayi TaxID=177813 RepID=UPI0028D30FC1|nr:NADH dehydrogenase subunit 4L [Olinga feredayi]WMQ76540.1 NADH dehydrogenase subunit 4L [Olinga feredayi]